MDTRINTILIALSSMQLVSGAATYIDNSQIIFPGPTQASNTRYGNNQKGNKTDPCAGQNFCTVKPHNYPQELFNKLFKGKYKEPIFLPTYVMTDNRQADSSEKSDCEGVVTYEPLYQLRDKNGEWVNVIQAPKENFVQMVRMETCIDRGNPCFTDFRSPLSMEAYCVQRYGSWEFLIHDGKETRKSTADLPTCCTCVYKVKGI